MSSKLFHIRSLHNHCVASLEFFVHIEITGDKFNWMALLTYVVVIMPL